MESKNLNTTTKSNKETKNSDILKTKETTKPIKREHKSYDYNFPVYNFVENSRIKRKGYSVNKALKRQMDDTDWWGGGFDD